MEAEYVRNLISVFVLSMTPFGELRIAIPYGVLSNVGVFPSLIISIIGNMIPALIILKLFDPFSQWIFSNSEFLKNKIQKYFNALHTKHSQKFIETGAIFLVFFVGIPLPGTGAWSGAILASLLAIPFRLAFGSILLGVIGAGILVALLSKSAITVFQLF